MPLRAADRPGWDGDSEDGSEHSSEMAVHIWQPVPQPAAKPLRAARAPPHTSDDKAAFGVEEEDVDGDDELYGRAVRLSQWLRARQMLRSCESDPLRAACGPLRHVLRRTARLCRAAGSRLVARTDAPEASSMADRAPLSGEPNLLSPVAGRRPWGLVVIAMAAALRSTLFLVLLDLA